MTGEERDEERSHDRHSDLELVDVLLRMRTDSNASTHRDQQIDLVLRAIRRPSVPRSSEPRPQLERSPKRTFLAAAALTLAATFVWMLGGPSQTALASVSDVLTALRRSGDRSYRLSVEPPEEAARFGLNGAMLHLRNGDQYLLIRTSAESHEAIDGFDGKRSFRIRGGEPVEIRDGTGAGRMPLPGRMSDIPFGDLGSALANLESDYVIDEFGPTSEQGGSRIEVRLVAHRRSREIQGPTQIEIVADGSSGMPRRIVFHRAKFQGSTEPRRLTLELVSEQGLDALFFTPEFHRSPR